MDIYSLYEELEAATKKIRELEEQISLLPDGQLMPYKNDRFVRWYVQYDHGSREYLPKTNLTLARQLAFKKYLAARVHDEERKIKATKALIEIYNLAPDSQPVSEAMALVNNPLMTDLLRDQVPELSDYASFWLSRPYPSLAPFQEERKIEAVNGLRVRSKSEAGIVSILVNRNIPFLYEFPLKIGNRTVYPDFTLLDIRQQSEKYLEHLGKMDDPRYAHDAALKIEAYGRRGIIPSRNLILTFETDSQPLNFAYVDSLLDYHFGS